MRALLRVLLLLLLGGWSLLSASAQTICPVRPAPGSPVLNPLDLYSQNGMLTVNLTLQNQKEDDGFMHYCYAYTYQGQLIEAPTLRRQSRRPTHPQPDRQYPGALRSRSRSGCQEASDADAAHACGLGHQHVRKPDDPCNATMIEPSSTNIHFHGLNISPTCHQDDVINTIIQSGDPAFQYQHPGAAERFAGNVLVSSARPRQYHHAS